MDISLLDATLVPIIIALVAITKKAGVASNWLPVIAVVLGVLGVWVYNQNPEWLAGIIIGLSAVGLHAGTKSVLKP